MKPYRLTDEEIEQCTCDLAHGVVWSCEPVAYAAQKKLLEYLTETCSHIDEDLGGEGVTQCFRYACSLCMQPLLEEFGL